jgi:hypothetical protein
MGGNVSGSAIPSGAYTGSQSSMPTGGKGSASPVQPYQGRQQASQQIQQPQQALVQQTTSGNSMFYNMSVADIGKYNTSHASMKKGGKVK